MNRAGFRNQLQWISIYLDLGTGGRLSQMMLLIQISSSTKYFSFHYNIGANKDPIGSIIYHRYLLMFPAFLILKWQHRFSQCHKSFVMSCPITAAQEHYFFHCFLWNIMLYFLINGNALHWKSHPKNSWNRKRFCV